MANPLPGLSDFCVNLNTGPGELCIEFPGGQKLCAQSGYDLGDPTEITRSLLAQVNSALMPLQPFFNILDTFKAVMDCITAIPDSLGPPPDPSKLLKCVPNLIQKVQDLLKLLPQFSLPILIKSIINTIIVALEGLRAELLVMLEQQQRLLAAATKAARLGNVELQVVVECASNNLHAQLQNKNAGMMPLNRLIGVINVLLELAGLDCIPSLGGASVLDDTIIKILDATIELLQTIKNLIPAPDLVLPALPGPDEPCK